MKLVKITFLHKQALKMVAKQNAFLTFLLKRDQILHLTFREMTFAAACEIDKNVCSFITHLYCA